MPPKKKPSAAAAAKPPTKAEVHAELATKTGLTQTQINAVFDALEEQIMTNLKKYKVYTLSGLLKIEVGRRAASKARAGRNPSTGETITIKAKAAHDVIKVRALTRLKAMADA